MKIKHDSALYEFSKLLELSTSEAEEKVLKRLERIVENDPENYGKKICEIYDFCDLKVVDVVSAINVENLTTAIFEAYCNLTIFGDGDCPCCGAKMEEVAMDYDLIESNGITPNEHTNVFVTKECPVCGEIITERYED